MGRNRHDPGLMLDPRHRRWVDLNSHPAKVIYFNFQPLEIVSQYRDPQFQVGENYTDLLNLRPSIWCLSWCLNTHFVPNISEFDQLRKLIRNDYGRVLGLNQSCIYSGTCDCHPNHRFSSSELKICCGSSSILGFPLSATMKLRMIEC